VVLDSGLGVLRKTGSEKNIVKQVSGSHLYSYSELKDRHRAERDGYPVSLSLRVHRALSWLDRAEKETEDADARFIFLWVSFNAAYANNLEDREGVGEQQLFNQFLGRLTDSDKEQQFYMLLWDRYAKDVRLFVENEYVYKQFWDFQNGLITEEQWQESFENSKHAFKTALGKKMDTKTMLSILFQRLYVLRNQLVHGGATWNGFVNRSQVESGAAILGDIVPVVIKLMMDHPNQLWGDPIYPVVES